MTKKELYDDLKSIGIKLRGINSYKINDLQKIYDESFEHGDTTCDFEPVEEDVSDIEPCEMIIHALEFKSGGWCNELGCSYPQGVYFPRNYDEYSILKQYADGEI